MIGEYQSLVNNPIQQTFLTLYHTITTFNDPVKYAVRKHCRKRRKYWKPAFSPFPTMFSTIPKKQNSNFQSYLFCCLQVKKVHSLVLQIFLYLEAVESDNF